MAYLNLLLRSVAYLLIGINMVLAEGEREELENISLYTVQKIASVNESVTDLAAQIASMTVLLAELEEQVMETNRSIIEQTNERIKEEVAALETSVAKVNDEIEAAETALKTSIAQTNDKIEAIDTLGDVEVMIVSGEQAAGDEKCVKVCAGSTGRKTTDWVDYHSDGLYYDVDISDCNFIRIPTVTTSVEGNGNHWKFTGTSSIYNTSPTTFRMYVQHLSRDIQDEKFETRTWNIEWIAVGYTC